MDHIAFEIPQQLGQLPQPTLTKRRSGKKRVRIIKKIRLASGAWMFISLERCTFVPRNWLVPVVH